jgi:hypothetical protein
MHVPLQSDCPAGQLHVPARHVLSGDEQLWAQVPQLLASVEVLVQEPPHITSCAGQTWQLPLTQKSDPGQAIPQTPQLCGSDCVEVQAPSQGTSPAGQAQAPALQDAPVAQALPQVPQLATSVAVVVHVPSHAVSPGGQ